MLKVYVTRFGGVLMILTGAFQVAAGFLGVDASWTGTGPIFGWGLIMAGLVSFGVGGRLAQVVETLKALIPAKK